MRAGKRQTASAHNTRGSRAGTIPRIRLTSQSAEQKEDSGCVHIEESQKNHRDDRRRTGWTKGRPWHHLPPEAGLLGFVSDVACNRGPVAQFPTVVLGGRLDVIVRESDCDFGPLPTRHNLCAVRTSVFRKTEDHVVCRPSTHKNLPLRLANVRRNCIRREVLNQNAIFPVLACLWKDQASPLISVTVTARDSRDPNVRE